MLTIDTAAPSIHPLSAPAPLHPSSEGPYVRRSRAATAPLDLEAAQALCDQLGKAAAAIAFGEQRLARQLVAAVEAQARLDGAPRERIAALFARALRARLDGDLSGTGNLYDLGAGPAEMLAAFRALVADTPIVRFGHLGANEAILRAAAGLSAVTLIDVGVGHGTQWIDLFDELAARPGGPPQVTLVGIEVPAPGEDPVAQFAALETNLGAHAAARGVPFRFRGIAARVEDVIDFGVAAEEAVIVNAAFAIHHVPDGDAVVDRARSRDAVLARLCALRPRALVLAEPNVEHNALGFADRVVESMHHYGLVFEILGELGVATDPRRIIEQSFFGREIVNIVGGEGPARQERHERLTSWQRRLMRLGFAPLPMRGVGARVAARLGAPRPFSVEQRDGATILGWKGEAMGAVTAWEAR
jgi:hypothetical protein